MPLSNEQRACARHCKNMTSVKNQLKIYKVENLMEYEINDIENIQKHLKMLIKLKKKKVEMDAKYTCVNEVKQLIADVKLFIENYEKKIQMLMDLLQRCEPVPEPEPEPEPVPEPVSVKPVPEPVVGDNQWKVNYSLSQLFKNKPNFYLEKHVKKMDEAQQCQEALDIIQQRMKALDREFTLHQKERIRRMEIEFKFPEKYLKFCETTTTTPEDIGLEFWRRMGPLERMRIVKAREKLEKAEKQYEKVMKERQEQYEKDMRERHKKKVFERSMRDVSTCPYALLGITKNATFTQMKKAYRKLALIHHPDKGGDVEYFKKINASYETLSKVMMV